MDHIEARHLGACDPNVADRFLQSSPSASTTVSASWTSRTRRESPRMEPFVRAAGRYQPAAPRKARASVQGALAPSCTGASDNDRSPPDLIPDLTNARTPLVAISFCTGSGDTPSSRLASPSGKDDASRNRLPPSEVLSASPRFSSRTGRLPLRSWRRPLSRIGPLVVARGTVLSESTLPSELSGHGPVERRASHDITPRKVSAVLLPGVLSIVSRPFRIAGGP
jgi:hypothetical protein